MVWKVILDELQNESLAAEGLVVVPRSRNEVNALEVLRLDIILTLAALHDIFLNGDSCLQEVLTLLELPFLQVYTSQIVVASPFLFDIVKLLKDLRALMVIQQSLVFITLIH